MTTIDAMLDELESRGCSPIQIETELGHGKKLALTTKLSTRVRQVEVGTEGDSLRSAMVRLLEAVRKITAPETTSEVAEPRLRKAVNILPNQVTCHKCGGSYIQFIADDQDCDGPFVCPSCELP